MDSKANGVGRPVIKVTSEKQVDEVIDSHPVLMYSGFVDQTSDKARAFLNAASRVDIQFAMIVAEDSQVLRNWGIGHQNIILKKNGRYLWYNGGSEADDIVSWAKKNTDPPIKITYVEQAKQMIAANNAVVFGCFANQETEKAKTFLKVADLIHEEVFAIISDENVIAELEAEDQDVVIFKKFDESPVKYEDASFTEDALKLWVVVETTPVLYEFSGELLEKLFEIEYPYTVQLFLSKQNGDFDKYIEKLKPVVKKYRDKIPISAVIVADEKECEWLMNRVEVKKTDVPCIRLIAKEKDSQGRKYKPPSNELTPESVEEFIESVLAGKVEPYWKRQDLPEDWDKKPVKVLVASNFDEVVNDTSKKVVVDFWAPWCGPCVALEPIYEKLGEHFKNADDVVIAKMDTDNNELEHVKLIGIPTIRLYDKDNQVYEYKGDRSLEDLIKFVESPVAEETASIPAQDEAPANKND